ncbi:hypothetical protein GA0061100_106262 [Rhizobium hainanense]|uniref:Uncharacterized protein n=1 Tax=Rhizobium hainanense TaxID=52131 RepID=A0A1C3VJI5_9HYPH|nr:hypothetical protein GA0061100_106262 [Rhizobium hainanense]
MRGFYLTGIIVSGNIAMSAILFGLTLARDRFDPRSQQQNQRRLMPRVR